MVDIEARQQTNILRIVDRTLEKATRGAEPQDKEIIRAGRARLREFQVRWNTFLEDPAVRQQAEAYAQLCPTLQTPIEKEVAFLRFTSSGPTYVQNRRDDFQVGEDYPTLIVLQAENTADGSKIYPSEWLRIKVFVGLGVKELIPSPEALGGMANKNRLDGLEGVDILSVDDALFPQVRLAFNLETFEQVLKEAPLPSLNKPSRFRRVASVIPFRRLRHSA